MKKRGFMIIEVMALIAMLSLLASTAAISRSVGVADKETRMNDYMSLLRVADALALYATETGGYGFLPEGDYPLGDLYSNAVLRTELGKYMPRSYMISSEGDEVRIKCAQAPYVYLLVYFPGDQTEEVLVKRRRTDDTMHSPVYQTETVPLSFDHYGEWPMYVLVYSDEIWTGNVLPKTSEQVF